MKKKCKICGKEKSLYNDFYYRHNVCKECRKELKKQEYQNKKHREENIERIRLVHFTYLLRNNESSVKLIERFPDIWKKYMI